MAGRTANSGASRKTQERAMVFAGRGIKRKADPAKAAARMEKAKKKASFDPATF